MKDSVSRNIEDFWDVTLYNLAWREKTRNAYRYFEKQPLVWLFIWLFYYCALITEII
jgi:hypothetical protein